MDTKLVLSFVIGFIAGILAGLFPLIVGVNKKQIGIGISGFFACAISGAAMGLMLAVPIAGVFCWLAISNSISIESTINKTQESLTMAQNLTKISKPSTPIYFPVSITKLVVMSLFTCGLYQILWFYKNWRLIKNREHSDIMPVWRSIFPVFFCHDFFKEVYATAVSINVGVPLQIGNISLATEWVLVTILGGIIPDLNYLLQQLTVVFLLPIQRTINQINESQISEYEPNQHFTLWNIAVIFIGVLFHILIIFGILFQVK